MSDYGSFFLLGLGAGALYAALGLGLVVAYRGSGVVNFSHAAVGMMVAYVFSGLRGGRLLVPPLPNPLAVLEGLAGVFGFDLDLPSFPAFVDLHSPVPTGLALLLSCVIAAGLGVALHFLVFRPLRFAPALAKTVASVGVLIVLQSVVVIRFGVSSISVPRILPQGSFEIGASVLPHDRAWMLGLTVVTTGILMWAYHRTRLGWLLRAASENEQVATLVGIRSGRLAAGTWILSCVLAGLAGILFSTIGGLGPTFVLLIVPALGAALMANFDSFGIVALMGLVIGGVESVAVLVQSEHSWFPRTGVAQVIPFVFIAIALVVRGKSLPDRGALTLVRLPRSPSPSVRPGPVGVLFAATILGAIFLPLDLRSGILNSLIATVAALSLVVVTGFAGQISLFQMSIAGLTSLLLARWSAEIGLPFPLNAVGPVAVAALCGLVAGLPAIRVRGVQLAVLTLGAAYAFEYMVLRNPDLVDSVVQSSGAIPAPEPFGFDLGINSKFPVGPGTSPSAWFIGVVLVTVLGCSMMVVGLRLSDIGRQFLSIRSDERAAAALGVHVARTKMLAFAVSAVLAAIAGALVGYQFESVSTNPFLALSSVSLLAFTYLGGISSVGGALFAGVLATGGIGYALTLRLADVGQYQPLVAGVGLVLMAIFNSEGIAGVMRTQSERFRRHGLPSFGSQSTHNPVDA